jgi:hypothetical protein
VCPVKGVVYDSLVRPARPITDYNTSYSGKTITHIDTFSDLFPPSSFTRLLSCLLVEIYLTV